MAATHFTFKVGSLEAFEHTFLFHRIETVRLVKKWLSSGDLTLSAAITKQIATLAYTEVWQMNVAHCFRRINPLIVLQWGHANGRKAFKCHLRSTMSDTRPVEY
jgi:hypothetical protein